MPGTLRSRAVPRVDSPADAPPDTTDPVLRFDGRFAISQLDANLHRQWSFDATNSQSCHRDASGVAQRECRE